MSSANSVWLAVDYHMPYTYSSRMPMTSMNSGLALPAPGPATVRLALIRTAIELYGIDYTRDELFPMIRSARVQIKPPEKVAISTQLVRGLKAEAGNGKRGAGVEQSIVYREIAHAQGAMTVFVEVLADQVEAFSEILELIGYWGQTSSFASCIAVRDAAPLPGECAVPITQVSAECRIKGLFSCLTSEFRDSQEAWEDIAPEDQGGRSDAIRVEIYVWPMAVCERRSEGILLARRSLV